MGGAGGVCVCVWGGGAGIAPDKRGYQANIFSYFSMKHMLGKVLLMSTHKICFHGEIRKISTPFG